MANQDDIALMAHLMRRPGFGASRDELEARVAKGDQATVEELLNPESQPPVDPYELLRYQPSALLPGGQPPMGNVNYMYYLVTTKRPLEEKMGLFWHHVLATGNSKVDNYDQLLEQIELFRHNGMGNYRDLLLKIAKNPTMIFWLDNNQNHGTAVNENWGRELLELFSLGVGRTGSPTTPRQTSGRPHAPSPAGPSNQDRHAATITGGTGNSSTLRKITMMAKRPSWATGNFDGEDIIDIIVQQPACHRFIARHLYNFFVADEPQVPAWSHEEPRDPEAVDTLAKAFRESNL